MCRNTRKPYWNTAYIAEEIAETDIQTAKVLISIKHYCAFNIFQKVVFCLVIYTDEVNLQTFVMI